ncbi:MAG TPA: hypothetical protein VNK41_11400, partial [Vicinamibacterales bacterium]|nr:hypothetical protein [Vicinamibacterales bacterium]
MTPPTAAGRWPGSLSSSPGACPFTWTAGQARRKVMEWLAVAGDARAGANRRAAAAVGEGS